MLLRHALLALGLLSSLPGQTQSAPIAPPTYYVGGGLYSSTFQNLGYHYGLTLIPVQVLAGYRWRPRWAVQLGAAYSGSSVDYDNRAEYFDPTTSSTYSNADTGHATDRRLSVTLLARHTLTRQPAHRVQFDAVGGLTYEYLSYRAQGLYTSTYSSAPAYNQYDSHERRNTLQAGAGLGTRVRIAAPLEVTFDYLLNTPLTSRPYSSSITSSASLGVRYSWGKPG